MHLYPFMLIRSLPISDRLHFSGCMIVSLTVSDPTVNICNKVFVDLVYRQIEWRGKGLGSYLTAVY